MVLGGTVRFFSLRQKSYLLLSLFCVWGLIEVGATFLLPVVPEPIYTLDNPDRLMPFHPERIWTLQPDVYYKDRGVLYHHDSQGLRAHELDDKPLIVGVGDSSTYGFGVTAEASYLHQTALCAGMGLINGGISGYSSSQSRILLQDILERTEGVEWVVVANLWSDLMFAEQPDDVFLQELREVDAHHKRLKKGFWTSSRVFQLLNRIWFSAFHSLPPPTSVYTLLKGEGEVRRVSKMHYIENMMAMAELSHEYGAKVVFLQHPTNRALFEDADPIAQDYRHGLDAAASKAGFMVLDMDMVYQPLPKRALKDRFLDEVHPSIQGHADIASELCELIRGD